MGDAKRINALPAIDEGEYVKLIEIDGGADIKDFDVGDGHVVVLTAKGEVWVTGDNSYGQLGVGKGTDFEAGWVRFCILIAESHLSILLQIIRLFRTGSNISIYPEVA